MKNKLLLISTAIVVMASVFFAGVYFGKNPITLNLKFPEFKKEVVKKDGILTYENSKFNFTFDYADTFEVTENETAQITYININDGYELLTLEVTRQTDNFFSSQPVSKVVTYNGINWNFHESSEYCDGGECNKTSEGYTTRNGDVLYSLVLSQTYSDPNTAIQILSSFRFL